MPIHLPPLSRRRFLTTSLAAGSSLLAWPARGAFESGSDENRFALISDTHIAADTATESRDVKMAEHLRQVIEQIQAPERRPGQVILAGDCAFSRGEPGDYATLTKLVAPLAEAGIPLHMTLGNHDDREHFRTAFTADKKQPPLLETKQVAILETPRANWFMLDSLIKTKLTPGQVGTEQRRWLQEALDARPDKPAIVVVHHHPMFPMLSDSRGLRDTNELLDILVPRKQVKAMVFGHTHFWIVAKYEGIHLVNLPPVSYIFVEGRPSGWVDAQIGESGMTLELRSLDPDHHEHGKAKQYAWRV